MHIFSQIPEICLDSKSKFEDRCVSAKGVLELSHPSDVFYGLTHLCLDESRLDELWGRRSLRCGGGEAKTTTVNEGGWRGRLK